MNILEVGKEYPGGRGHSEGVLFDMDDTGAKLIIFFDSPTEEERGQFKQDMPFEIRFTTLSDIIMITVKIGNLEWMDAPYSPKLSKNLSKFTLPDKNEGLALTVMLVDSRTGILKSIRLLGLSNHFTGRLFGEVMEQMMKPFDADTYSRNLASIYRRYQTKEIVKMSKTYCKFQ